MSDRLLVTDEVSRLLRLEASTIRDWAKQGKIPANRVGRSWRFDEADIVAWIASGAADALKRAEGVKA